jgi:hypothetical protein
MAVDSRRGVGDEGLYDLLAMWAPIARDGGLGDNERGPKGTEVGSVSAVTVVAQRDKAKTMKADSFQMNLVVSSNRLNSYPSPITPGARQGDHAQSQQFERCRFGHD